MQTLGKHELSFEQRQKFLTFRKVLDLCFPPGEAPTLKSRYVQVGLNQFRNEYLREVVNAKPEYNDYLRVHAGDGEVISNKMEAVPDIKGRNKTDLNEVFS